LSLLRPALQATMPCLLCSRMARLQVAASLKRRYTFGVPRRPAVSLLFCTIALCYCLLGVRLRHVQARGMGSLRKSITQWLDVASLCSHCSVVGCVGIVLGAVLLCTSARRPTCSAQGDFCHPVMSCQEMLMRRACRQTPPADFDLLLNSGAQVRGQCLHGVQMNGVTHASRFVSRIMHKHTGWNAACVSAHPHSSIRLECSTPCCVLELCVRSSNAQHYVCLSDARPSASSCPSSRSKRIPSKAVRSSSSSSVCTSRRLQTTVKILAMCTSASPARSGHTAEAATMFRAFAHGRSQICLRKRSNGRSNAGRHSIPPPKTHILHLPPADPQDTSVAS
jgi:hypothetical protein